MVSMDKEDPDVARAKAIIALLGKPSPPNDIVWRPCDKPGEWQIGVSFGPLGDLEYHFRPCPDWTKLFEDERIQGILDFLNNS